MMDASFLPFDLAASNDARILLVVGTLLAAGVIGAEICKRLLHLPAIAGFVVTGLIIGPPVLNLLTADALREFRFVVDVALGLVLFELGRRIDCVWLLRERWLLLTGLLVEALVFCALYLLLETAGIGQLMAAMAAAIGITTSPAVALLLVRELRAEGQLTERMLHLTALSNVTAFLLFSGLLTMLQLQQLQLSAATLFGPISLFALSVLLGWLAAGLLTYCVNALPDRVVQHRALILATIMLLLGVGHWLGFSALLALLVLGMASRVEQGRLLVCDTDLTPLDSLLCIVLFVYAGASLTFDYMRENIWLALQFVLLRSGVAVLLGGLLARLNGISLKKSLWLGLSLYPMSGTAMVLIAHTATYHPEFALHLSALLASVFCILELSGPLVLRQAIRASGEARPQPEPEPATARDSGRPTP